MVAKDMSDHQDIWNIIQTYYRDPKAAASMVRKEMEAMVHGEQKAAGGAGSG
jgi:hypothetical protein